MSSSVSLESICLEDLDAAVPRFVRCVALPAGRLGLGLAADGTPAWRDDAAACCPIAVTADGALALTRAAEAPTVRVERAGRAVDVPALRPALLRDGDVLIVNGHRVRLYRHGPVDRVHRPRLLRGTLAAVAAAAAIALAAGAPAAAGGSPPIEVRDQPPAPMPPRDPPAQGSVVKVALGETKGAGTVDRAALARKLEQGLPAIRACYDGLSRKGVKAAGSATIVFTLGDSGRPDGLKLRSNNTGSKELGECVVKTVTAQTFAPPQGGTVKVSAAYGFQPAKKSDR